MNAKHTIFLLYLFFIVNTVVAQTGESIKTSTDKNRILIGEPLKLTIEMQFDNKNAFHFLPFDSIPHFEQLEKPVIDSVMTSKGKMIRGVYTLTSFDSGHWVIPSFSLSKTIKSDTIGIDVVFSDFDAKQDYHDIQDIIEVKAAKKKTPWWWYAAGGLLLLGLVLFYFLRKRMPVPETKKVVTINPYDEAMLQLANLAKEKPEDKKFHSSLTDIFRLYIFRKNGILSLQKTTDDLVVQLKALTIKKEDFERLSQSLRLSDFVKFAKFSPSEEDNIKCYNDILNAIKAIEHADS